jgi:hypothetical protein
MSLALELLPSDVLRPYHCARTPLQPIEWQHHPQRQAVGLEQ